MREKEKSLVDAVQALLGSSQNTVFINTNLVTNPKHSTRQAGEEYYLYPRQTQNTFSYCKTLDLFYEQKQLVLHFHKPLQHVPSRGNTATLLLHNLGIVTKQQRLSPCCTWDKAHDTPGTKHGDSSSLQAFNSLCWPDSFTQLQNYLMKQLHLS